MGGHLFLEVGAEQRPSGEVFFQRALKESGTELTSLPPSPTASLSVTFPSLCQSPAPLTDLSVSPVPFSFPWASVLRRIGPFCQLPVLLSFLRPEGSA